MAQITSREQLEEWLKDKPEDWAQVIAARAALRALPYSFDRSELEKSPIDHPMIFFRAAIIVCDVSNITTSGSQAAARFAASALRANVVTRRSRSTDDRFLSKSNHASRAVDAASYALARAADTTYKYDNSFSNFTARASFAAHAEVYAAGRAAIAALSDDDSKAPYFVSEAYDVDSPTRWSAVSDDCNWVSDSQNHKNASLSLKRRQLWINDVANEWLIIWQKLCEELFASNPTYQVWIDWYNRRVEGHDAAFDIPGDTDRVHDKAILARLADATDEGFWGKGATYVNTTLQRWIDEARLTAELESIVRRLGEGAATQFGSPEARETLAALRTKLEAALGNQTPAHAPIGHNHPPEGINPAEAPILPPAIREEAQAMLVTIDQPTPGALVVAKTLTGWSKIKSTFQHDEFSKNFSGELGTSTARGIVLILTSLCLLGLAWLKVMLAI